MSEADKLRKYGEVVGRFNSQSKPDAIYEVRRKDGKHTCQCPGYRFRRNCRHIEHVERYGPLYEDEPQAVRTVPFVAAAKAPAAKQAQPVEVIVAKPRPIRMFTFAD